MFGASAARVDQAMPFELGDLRGDPAGHPPSHPDPHALPAVRVRADAHDLVIVRSDRSVHEERLELHRFALCPLGCLCYALVHALKLGCTARRNEPLELTR